MPKNPQNLILAWGIQNATYSAGKTSLRPGNWSWFWTGLLLGGSVGFLFAALVL